MDWLQIGWIVGIVIVTIPLVAYFLTWVPLVEGPARAVLRLPLLPLGLLSAIPGHAMSRITTPADWILLVVRAFAVIVSPVAFGLALFKNAAIVGAQAPFLVLLPLVVLATDWANMAAAADGAKKSGGLVVLRIFIVLLSLFMATTAAFWQEQEAIGRRLVEIEDDATHNSAAYQQLVGEKKALEGELVTNRQALQDDLQKRADLQSQANGYRRLQQQECEGRAGIDPETGEMIVGGQECGENAATHRINAEAKERALLALVPVVDHRESLQAQINAKATAIEELVVANRSNKDSLSTLLNGVAAGAVDWGVWVSLAFTVIIMLVMETFALVMSGIALTTSLTAAIKTSKERDEQRLRNYDESLRAEETRQHRLARASAGSELPPIIAPLPRPTILRVVDDESEREVGRA